MGKQWRQQSRHSGKFLFVTGKDHLSNQRLRMDCGLSLRNSFSKTFVVIKCSPEAGISGFIQPMNWRVVWLKCHRHAFRFPTVHAGLCWLSWVLKRTDSTYYHHPQNHNKNKTLERKSRELRCLRNLLSFTFQVTIVSWSFTSSVPNKLPLFQDHSLPQCLTALRVVRYFSLSSIGRPVFGKAGCWRNTSMQPYIYIKK